MRKLIIILSMLGFSAYCHADTSPEDRRAKLIALYKKYPCKKLVDDVNRELCEFGESAIDARYGNDIRGIGDSEVEWKRHYKSTEKQMQDDRDEDARVRNKIRPKIGMTKEYIYRHVLGPPDAQNDTESISGISSQWVYESDAGTQYLYFNNRGVLTTIQTDR